MAPKSKFTKTQIIDAAFEIARTDGIDAITIRKVAEKLGSSIAPIYVNFKDVDELVQEVIARTLAISRQLFAEQNTGHPFYDIGIASLRFAKEYSVLFRDLVMKKNDHLKVRHPETDLLVDMMKQDPELEGLPEEELKTILLKMQIFQTGLSVMAANGLLPDDFGEEALVGLLNGAAEDMMAAARLRHAENHQNNSDQTGGSA